MTDKDEEILRHPSSSGLDNYEMPQFSYRDRAITSEEIKTIGIAAVMACAPFIVADAVDVLYDFSGYVYTRYAEAWVGFR